jgi:16S rRNA (guanine966-N2)-methyltransferase
MKVEQFLAGEPEPRYDVAFLDPPYDVDVAPVLTALLPWLAEDAVVAVERRTRYADLSWPDGLRPQRSRRYGEATLWYALA